MRQRLSTKRVRRGFAQREEGVPVREVGGQVPSAEEEKLRRNQVSFRVEYQQPVVLSFVDTSALPAPPPPTTCKKENDIEHNPR